MLELRVAYYSQAGTRIAVYLCTMDIAVQAQETREPEAYSYKAMEAKGAIV